MIAPAGAEAAWAPPLNGVQPTRWAEVDAAALRDNAAAMCRLAGGAQVMAMVKANGYGHGALVAARSALAGGAGWLGVATAEEALQLRGAGIGAPTLVAGWTHPSAHPSLVAAGVDVAVWDAPAVGSLAAAAAAAGRAARVHLKLDTGMGRLGARPAPGGAGDELAELLAALEAAGPAVEVVGVFTHLAESEAESTAFTERQHRSFLETLGQVRQRFPDALAHCANSGAALRFPELRLDLIRTGIALYGYPPVAPPPAVALRSAMTLRARVAHVKTVRRGDSVGYGRTWTATGDHRVATISIGYADGVQRAAANRGVVLAGGVRCPMIGRVSMDQLGVDVSAGPELSPGDPVVLFGRGADGATLGADEVGERLGTVAYEVLCAVSPRVPRMVRG